MQGLASATRQDQAPRPEVSEAPSSAPDSSRPPRQLALRWFTGWQGAIDDYAADIPPHPNLPLELLRELQLTNPAAKRTAVFFDGGRPVAILGLRRAPGGGVLRERWEVVTNSIVPGVLCLASPDYEADALWNVDRRVRVAWWRQHRVPPALRNIHSLVERPTFRFDLSQDLEAYWKQSDHLRTVRRMRNRCRDFTVQIDPPGASDWAIANWGVRFGISKPEVDDRIVTARYLGRMGRFHALMLCDGEKWIAAETLVEDGRDLAWQVCHRDMSYQKQGIGTYLMDRAFHWAQERGYRSIDLGADHPYKSVWAPRSGARYTFRVDPRIGAVLRGMLGQVRTRLRR